MKSSAALTAAAAAGPMALAQSPKNIVIASANGLQPCKKAMETLRSGADTLDAVIAGVNIVELDPNDHSVGYGGLPNEEGVVELDASVMHGISFYALRKDGMYAGVSLWSVDADKASNVPRRQTSFAVNDGGDSRHEPCVSLYERK